jgi:hypothetical protein
MIIIINCLLKILILKLFRKLLLDWIIIQKIKIIIFNKIRKLHNYISSLYFYNKILKYLKKYFYKNKRSYNNIKISNRTYKINKKIQIQKL